MAFCYQPSVSRLDHNQDSIFKCYLCTLRNDLVAHTERTEAPEIIMIQRILEAGQRKTFYYVRIRDQGYKLSKLFFLLNRDSCPDHANSVSLIHNLDWNMILQSDPQKFNISKQMVDSCSGCSQQRNFLCSKRNCFPDRRFRVRIVFDRV